LGQGWPILAFGFEKFLWSTPASHSLATGENIGMSGSMDGHASVSDKDKDIGEPAAPNVVWPIKDKEGFYTVPFSYGSIAFWQGKRAPEFQTHRWYVRCE
jgi:hypothetical protein